MTAVLPEIGEVSRTATRSAGRHRAPEDATTGSMGIVPLERCSRSAHGSGDERPAPRRARHDAPVHPLSRAARTAGLSLAALGAVATAGGMATHGLLGSDDASTTGETSAPELAAANLALAPGASATPSDAATQVMPVASSGGSGASTIKHDSPNTRAAAQRAAEQAQAAQQRAAQSSQAASDDDQESTPAASSGSSLGARALAEARSQIGKPYVWGATGPSSFDCSGLTQWAFEQAGADIPRTSRAQSQAGQEVDMDNLQPGDLIFFYSPVSHVGIYAGNGQFIEAPQSGEDVKMSPLSRRMDDAVGARRITG